MQYTRKEEAGGTKFKNTVVHVKQQQQQQQQTHIITMKDDEY